MTKKVIVLGVLVLIILINPAVALGQKPSAENIPAIPEKSGDYKDPENPQLRVRVFVHDYKERPQTTTLAACDDPSSDSIVHAAGWKLPLGSWTYNLNPSSAPSSIGATNFGVIANNSLATWQQSIQSKVTFSRGADTTRTKNSYDGLNIIAFGRTSGTTLGVTYVRYYPSTGQAVDIDTILNQRVPWSWNACGSNTYDVQNILTHENGHTMGLDDEYTSSYSYNTMFGYGSKDEIQKDTLTTGDITGVKAIYP